jgi:tRNA pseudouridine55 synthase
VDGILIINKPLKMTSHDVVARVRKLLRQKRVGHTGTLDPLASGVLPLCVGQATRVAEYLSESGKAYEAEITFGSVTDTYDTEGTVTRTGDISMLTSETIAQEVASFLGPQMQHPPLYSAIKLQGQPAYKLARAGTEVTLEARPIEISELRILSWQSPRLRLAVECSKGTYIRSLAYDLGEKLGCGAHLSGLVRTRSGPFTLAESITLEELATAADEGSAANHLLPADRALQHFPALRLDEETTNRVLHGNAFPYEIAEENSTAEETMLARVYDPAGRFLAIATWDFRERLWQPKKVLAEH